MFSCWSPMERNEQNSPNLTVVWGFSIIHHADGVKRDDGNTPRLQHLLHSQSFISIQVWDFALKSSWVRERSFLYLYSSTGNSCSVLHLYYISGFATWEKSFHLFQLFIMGENACVKLIFGEILSC